MIAGNSNQTISAASAVKIQVNPSQRCFFVNEVASQIKILVVNANAPTYPIQPSAISTMRCKKLSKLSKLLDFEPVNCILDFIGGKNCFRREKQQSCCCCDLLLECFNSHGIHPLSAFRNKIQKPDYSWIGNSQALKAK